MVAMLSQTAVNSLFQPINASPAHEYGSLDAFNQLVLEHQDAVYRQAYWILGDEDAAADAAQEAFIRAYRNMHLFNGGPFKAWVLRICTNYCLDQLRRVKAHRSVPLDAYNEYDEEVDSPSWVRDPGMAVEDMVASADEQAIIRRCINRLPEDYRLAVLLVDVQEMDYREASTIAGVSLGTFKSRLSRARVRLQKELKGQIF